MTPTDPPAQVRAAAKRQSAGKYKGKVAARERRKGHVAANPAPRDEYADVFQG